jgi:hypothetical protein
MGLGCDGGWSTINQVGNFCSNNLEILDKKGNN